MDIKILSSTDCNINCQFCLCCNTPSMYDHLTTSKMRKCYRHALINGAQEVTFSGGEPTLRSISLADDIRVADEYFGKISLTTNATLLTRELLDAYYKAGLTNITISIPSLNVDVYQEIIDSNRHEPPLDITLYAAELGIITRISVVICKGLNDTEKDFEQWDNLLSESPIQQISFVELIKVNQYSEDYFVPASEFSQKIPTFKEILFATDWGLSVYDMGKYSMSICEYKADLREEHSKNKQKSKEMFLFPDGVLRYGFFNLNTEIM